MYDEYNRSIARRLCADRYIELEIARLDEKLRILRERGELSPSEAALDALRRQDARAYLDASEPRLG